MGMKFHTDVMGDVTANVGIITYDKRKRWQIWYQFTLS